MWVLGLVACTAGPDGAETDTDAPLPTEDTGSTAETSGSGGHTAAPDGPAITAGPTLSLPENAQLRLAQILEVTTDVPTQASIVVDDGARRRRVTFPGRATTHALPVLELHQDTDYDVEVTLTDEAGAAVSAVSSFHTAVVPELIPKFDVLVHEPSAEGGIHVLTAEGTGVPSMIVAVDEGGQVVWASATVVDTKAVSFEPSTGRLSWLTGNVVYRMNAAGQDAVAYASQRPDVKDAIPVATPAFHHEAAFEPDGSFWSFHKDNLQVDQYPVTDQTPLVMAPATIAADVVTHVGADGTVLGEWSMADLLPTQRIGYYSSQDEPVKDWTHANAIVPLSDEDAFLVSLRHQDAVIRIRQSTGQIEWILGNHDAWPPTHQGYLLEPVGEEFLWQYHQHAPAVDAQGGIWLYDNGNEHRTTPYSKDPEPGPDYSRVVRFEVDPVRREIRQTFWFANDQPYPHYSNLLGNADPMPRTGHVLVTFPALAEEDGVDNASVGRGQRTTRIREIDPATGEVVYDLRAYADHDDLPGGYLTDRAIAVPTLYRDDVTVEWLD